MKKILFVALTLVLFATPAFSSKTKDGYPACLSEERYDELVKMVANKDERGFNYLIQSKKCVVLKEGLDLSVLDLGFSKSKVRIYVNGTAVDMWMMTKGIEM